MDARGWWRWLLNEEHRAAFGLVAIGSAFWLGGCTTGDDPREGGFLGGADRLGSGGNQRRIEEREATTHAEEARQAAQRQSATNKERQDRLLAQTEVAFGPPASIGGAAVGGVVTFPVRASRLFAGPGQYPPKSFVAYGIVAFPSDAAPHDRERYLLVCEAYMAALPHTDDLWNVLRKEQMVTVWPVESVELAVRLNDREAKPQDACQDAVDQYDSVTGRRAIKEAKRARAMPYLRGNGPYLLAWAPGATKGAQDALVLVADLSYMDDYDDLRDVFLKWADDIENNPELWRQGWAVERVRQTLRVWADRFGAEILSFVTGK